MDDATKVEFERVHDEDRRQNKRLDELEGELKSLKDIALSVQKLAINMEAMLKEQQKQGARLDKLEAEPGEKWSAMQKTIFNTIIGAIAGAFAIGMVQIVATHM